ncbi:Methyltransferase domain-containing protein [Tindallia magadiensis]|uniref:Methyltransferase domain-containing protein n=1 Tax=Tindallia magadiensis TaxID=69895 RepID=A0A1I3I1Y6_9FIRM|nr:class I SAM-dependent methyltransferase [Tindallia magadiensis]SFI41860.1 Methyltransferase domain-containing protein [Tindallia magadiensis]
MSSKEYFKEIAEKWDVMSRDFFSEKVREKAYELAEVKPGKKAADIGAGTGFISEGLLDRGLTVIAIDQSNEMLEVMKKNFSGNNSIEYKVGVAEELPIESNSVDYAFANMYIHHVEKPLLAIREMVRILRPGGRIVITDLDKHNHEFLAAEQFDKWLGFEREEVLKWFEDAGLRKVKIDCVESNCCSVASNGSESASISIFAAFGEK